MRGWTVKAAVSVTATLLITVSSAAATLGAEVPPSVTDLSDCDCAVRAGTCAAGIQLLETKWVKNDADERDELHWTVRLSSSESKQCSMVQAALLGHAGSQADLDMGSHGIYRRIVRGETTIKDWQAGLPAQSKVAVSGFHNKCYVCGSKAEAAKRAREAEENARLQAAALQKQLQARAERLAVAAGQALDQSATNAGKRLEGSKITDTSAYQQVLDAQQQAANADGAMHLQDAVSSIGNQVAARARGRLDKVEAGECAATIAQIKEYERYAGTMGNTGDGADSTKTEIRRLTAEAANGNRQWYNQNCR